VKIRVRLFAGLRERAGRDELEIELPAGATADDLLEAMAETVAGTPCVVAVNRVYSAGSQVICDGDEVALVPPVSGGAAPFVRIGPEPIDVAELTRLVTDPAAGAVVAFTGMPREIAALEYEAYVEMAAEQIERICEEAIATHGLTAAAAVHRTGRVPLGEASVAVAASSPHRPEAFHGAREMIDRIKAEAPIWKVEVNGADRKRVDGAMPQADRLDS
jgi:molybdopterin synthase catalytic subunit